MGPRVGKDAYMVGWLVLLALSQDAPVVEARLSDVPAAEGRGPRFLAEGRAAVPDGHTLILYLHYGHTERGTHLLADRAVVRQGAFSHELAPFKTKNLAGPWILVVVYDPNLQAAGGNAPGAARIETRLHLGTPEEAAEDRRAVMERLAGEFKALDALGREVLAKSSAEPRPDAAEWKTLMNGWKRKSIEIQRRAQPALNPDYRAVGIGLVADAGFEKLGHIFLAAADCAAKGQHAAAVEGFTRLSDTVAQYVGELAAASPARSSALLAELRALVADPAAPVPPRRRRFHEIVQELGKAVPENRQDLVLQVTQLGTRAFAAMADQDPSAAGLRDRLLEAVGTLEAALKP